MNHVDRQYLDLLKDILDNGTIKKNRTGIDTISVFGRSIRCDLSKGLPLLTTKKVHFKSIVHELLWMISGSTNIQYLEKNGVSIWREWPYKDYCKKREQFFEKLKNQPELFHDIEECCFPELTVEQFAKKIAEDDTFASSHGDLGSGAYGRMFRAFPGTELDGETDQLKELMVNLKKDPMSRRHIITLWHPAYVKKSVLPPCHYTQIYNCVELTEDERRSFMWDNPNKFQLEYNGINPDDFKMDDFDDWDVPKYKLNSLLLMRSIDVPLGMPFNIAFYSLMNMMICHCLNYVPGEFVWTGADVHIYSNQIEGINEQLKREGYEHLPGVLLNPAVKNLFDFKFDDIGLIDYSHDPAIKMPVAV